MKWFTRGELVAGRAGIAWALGARGLTLANHLVPLPHHTPRGLFKTDRVLGIAQLKLDALETACEVREILEVRCGHSSEYCSTTVSLVSITQILPAPSLFRGPSADPAPLLGVPDLRTPSIQLH